MGRASKRQQRAQDQLRQLGFSNSDVPSLGTQDDKLSDTDLLVQEALPSRSHFSTAINTFASLDGQDQSEWESGEENSRLVETSVPRRTPGGRKKAKSKKKLGNETSNPASSSNVHDLDLLLSSDPLEKLKDKKDEISRSIPSRNGTGSDEIDKALRELGLADATLDIGSGSFGKSRGRVEALCSVDCKMLDSDQELRRMFGSRVVSSALNSTRSSPTPHHPRISNNPHHQVNLRSKMEFLARPQATWPRFDKLSLGLAMRALSPEETNNISVSCPQETWFTFEHSPRFKATQSKFVQAIMSHDPNRLMPIFQSSPYHPDTLLQLSDVSAQQGDLGQSLDFLNRALFSFEKCFSPLFNLSKGLARLDFSKFENRGFYRAIEKNMQLLAKRGCWRTAFETCKLLFALDPYQDPYGALLWIDFLAPKAKQYQYFLNLSRDYPGILPCIQGIPIAEYPGFAYASALCMWHLEEENNESHENSSQALQTAIIRFPQVICPLAAKTGFSVPANYSIVERALPRQGFIDGPGHVLHLQSHIYVARSGDLWKEPGVFSWIQAVISQCHHRLDDTLDPDVILGQKYLHTDFSTSFMMGVYRTVVLSDVPTLKAFLSPAYLQATSYSFDPLPPSASSYDNDGQQATEQLQRGFRDSGLAQQRALGVIFDQIMLGVADVEEPTLQQLQGGIERLQRALQDEDANLTPQQRQALMELLLALLMQWHEQVDGLEENGNEQEGNTDDLPADRDIGDVHADADAISEQVTGDTSRVAMPGAFRHEEPTVDDEARPNEAGMMDTMRRWLARE